MITHARTHEPRTHTRTHEPRTHVRTHEPRTHTRTHEPRTHELMSHARTESLRTHARMSHARTHGVTPHACTHAWDVARFKLTYKYVYIVSKFHFAIMAHRVHVFSRELNTINDVKQHKEKCSRIIDEGGMELVHCICDCVHNILQGNIPVSEEETEILKKHTECLRKLVNKKTSYREKKQLIQEGEFLGSLIPTLVGLVGKLFTGQ